MTDTEILAYIEENVRGIDQTEPMMVITLQTGQSFMGLNLSACVLAAVAAGF